MRLTVVGCAGSFPGPDSAASCYLVQAEDADGRTWNVALDLGSGALGPLQRHLDPALLDAVALSHLHPDHYADMTGLQVFMTYRPGPAPAGRSGHRLPVYGPFGTASRLAAAYGNESGAEGDHCFDVRTWQAGHAVTVGPLTITPVAMDHPVPAYGMVVTGPSEADPDATVTLAYTGDTDECAGLDTLVRGADVLLAEAAFVEGRDDQVRGIHLTGLRAGRAAAAGGVGRLVLTHVPSWNEPGLAAREAAVAFDGPVLTAHPGLVVEL